MLIDNNLLDQVSAKAKESERLRMNYNLHDSLDAKAQRLLNALEPGTVLSVHRHTLEVKESGTVIFEVKDGPYASLGEEDILE